MNHLKSYYKQYNNNTKFFVIVFMELNQKSIDFNVSTDKKEILFGNLENTLKEIFVELVSGFIEELKADQKIC